VNERAGRKISAKVLAEVVSARYEELFNLVRNELKRNQLDEHIAAGIVITGGASAVHGAIELAEACFEMPVRHGRAQQVGGLVEVAANPAFATAVGLLLHGFQQQHEGGYNVPVLSDSASGMWIKMRKWFHGNF